MKILSASLDGMPTAVDKNEDHEDDKIRHLKRQLSITENNYVSRLQDELAFGVIRAARQHRLDIVDSLLRVVDDKRLLCARIEEAFGASADSLKYCELYNEIGAVGRVFARFVAFGLFPRGDDAYYYLRKLVFYYFYKLARFRATTPPQKLAALVCDHVGLLRRYGRSGPMAAVAEVVAETRRLAPEPSAKSEQDEDLAELVRSVQTSVFPASSFQPVSLTLICRNRIRNSMSSLSEHNIQLLGLPPSLKNIFM